MIIALVIYFVVFIALYKLIMYGIKEVLQSKVNTKGDSSDHPMSFLRLILYLHIGEHKTYAVLIAGAWPLTPLVAILGLWFYFKNIRKGK